MGVFERPWEESIRGTKGKPLRRSGGTRPPSWGQGGKPRSGQKSAVEQPRQMGVFEERPSGVFDQSAGGRPQRSPGLQFSSPWGTTGSRVPERGSRTNLRSRLDSDDEEVDEVVVVYGDRTRRMLNFMADFLRNVGAPPSSDLYGPESESPPASYEAASASTSRTIC